MIEVIELSSDSNPEVEINVGENEALEVESPCPTRLTQIQSY